MPRMPGMTLSGRNEDPQVPSEVPRIKTATAPFQPAEAENLQGHFLPAELVKLQVLILLVELVTTTRSEDPLDQMCL